MLLWSRSRPSAFCRIVEGARGCGPLIDLVLLWAGLAAAAGPRDEAGAGQRDAEEGEHEQQRGARQRDRQGLVDVAHDRAQGLHDLDGRGRGLGAAGAGVVDGRVAAAVAGGREGRRGFVGGPGPGQLRGVGLRLRGRRDRDAHGGGDGRGGATGGDERHESTPLEWVLSDLTRWSVALGGIAPAVGAAKTGKGSVAYTTRRG